MLVSMVLAEIKFESGRFCLSGLKWELVFLDSTLTVFGMIILRLDVSS